jgi:hypothetical protein
MVRYIILYCIQSAVYGRIIHNHTFDHKKIQTFKNLNAVWDAPKLQQSEGQPAEITLLALRGFRKLRSFVKSINFNCFDEEKNSTKRNEATSATTASASSWCGDWR